MKKNKAQKNLVVLWEKYINLAAQEGVISFASGRPEEKVYMLSLPKLQSCFEEALCDVKNLGYSPPAGSTQLKEAIAQMMKKEEGLSLAINNILITSGGQQAIDLVAKTFLKTNDTVLAEKKSYVGFQQSILGRGAKIKLLTQSLEKIPNQKLENIVKKFKIKLFYVIPDFANPTGDTLSLQKRKELATLAKKYKFLILEDQTYRYLYFHEKPPASFYTLSPRRVIGLGTASKIIVPGLRIGWLIGSEKIINAIAREKNATDLFTSTANQQVVAELIQDEYYFNSHLKKIRSFYHTKMKILLDSLERYIPRDFSWNKPDGGFFVWINGPKGFNSQKIFFKGIRNGVGFMPGFVADYQNSSYSQFRLSISAVPKNQIAEGIKRLSATLRGKRIKASYKRKNWVKKALAKLFNILSGYK